jgi:3-oxoacyl-(acyl-carrier-protein) synthase
MNELKTRGVTTSRSAQIEYLMSNNVAFGGINTSLVFRRV